MEERDKHLMMWAAAGVSAFISVTAKVCNTLYGGKDMPPDDSRALAAWRMRRRWLAISEYSAVPAYMAFAVFCGIQYDWSIAVVSLISMALGVLGYDSFARTLSRVKSARLPHNGEDASDDR